MNDPCTTPNGVSSFRLETCCFKWGGPSILGTWCPNPVWRPFSEEHCIFHSDKNGKDDESARLVWKEARRKVSSGDCLFIGWHFPHDPDNQFFQEYKFASAANFSRCVFHEQVSFHNSVFSKDVTFANADFCKGSGFSHVYFEGQSNFAGVKFGSDWADVTDDVRDWARHLARSHTIEGSTASFSQTAFCGDAFFNGATFNDHGLFWEAVFKANVTFVGATFRMSASFSMVQISGDADFSEASFPSSAWFDQIKIMGKVAFLLAPSTQTSRLSGTEEMYRLAKRSAQQDGDDWLTGQYHYAERCASEEKRRRQCCWKPLLKKFWTPSNFRSMAGSLVERIFVRTIFGYGERPLRIGMISLATILLFAILYASRSNTFYDALHLSLTTFVTLGLTDAQQVAPVRFLADIEALLGTALVSLFVVALTRRYAR